MANMKALVRIEDFERGQALRTVYPEPPGLKGHALVGPLRDLCDSTEDWQFYSYSYGFQEVRFALSPALGLSRPLLHGEAYELTACSAADYERLHGPIPDPLAPEQILQREKKQASQERRFNIQLSYSTIGTSPEDALATFFAAVTRPGAMVAEIYEEGVERVVEIDGDEIVRIAASQFRQHSPDSDPEDETPGL